jgi:hypothetical protein
MKLILFVLLFLNISISANPSELLEAKSIKNFNEADSQVGKYPTNDGPFLKSPCLVKEFKRILKDDYDDYFNRFIETCATYPIEKKGNTVCIEKGEAHVGLGWRSFILLDLKTNRMQLLWLRSSWQEGDIKTYGDMPLTDEAKALILEKLNGSWGFSVNSSFENNQLILKQNTQ